MFVILFFLEPVVSLCVIGGAGLDMRGERTDGCGTTLLCITVRAASSIKPQGAWTLQQYLVALQ